MSEPLQKNIFDLFLPLAPKATPADEAEARRLGVTVNDYRARKLEAGFGVAWRDAAKKHSDATPPVIAAESAEARRLRHAPGLFKRRNEEANILVQATKTPGEVAKTVLFVLLYVLAMAGLINVGGEKVHKLPGIFQTIGLGVLIIPVMWATGRLWETMGEGARNVCRVLVRFWPLTLIGLLVALGALKQLMGGATGP